MSKHIPHGQAAVTTIAAALSANVTQIGRDSLIIKAHAGNSGSVYIGETGVTTSTGYPLAPGEEIAMVSSVHPRRETFKPADVYVVGTNGDRVAWMGRQN
jgi:hypothetical protein